MRFEDQGPSIARILSHARCLARGISREVFYDKISLSGYLEETCMDIGARVKSKRKRAQLSQEALARRAGLSLNAIAQLEQGGRTDPHYSTLNKIANGLGISVSEILEEPALAGKAQAPSPPPRTVAELLDAAGVEDRELERPYDKNSPGHIDEMFDGLSYEETMALAQRIIKARRAVYAFINSYRKDANITPAEKRALDRLDVHTMLVNSIAILRANEATGAEAVRAKEEGDLALAEEVERERERILVQGGV